MVPHALALKRLITRPVRVDMRFRIFGNPSIIMAIKKLSSFLSCIILKNRRKSDFTIIPLTFPISMTFRNPKLKFWKSQELKKGQYFVHFKNSKQVYKLLFHNETMECIDNKKVQKFTKVNKVVKPKFKAVFKSYLWICDSDSYIFVDVKTKQTHRFYASIAGNAVASNCQFKDYSVKLRNCKSYVEAANKAFLNKIFDIVIEKGLFYVPLGKGEYYIGDMATVKLSE